MASHSPHVKHVALACVVLICSSLHAVAAPVLNCEVCQVLCIVLEEAIDDLRPKGRLDTLAAASKVVGAAPGKDGPCKNVEIWEATATKVGVPVTNVHLACRKQLERLEEPLEAALGDPALRGEAFRQKICAPAKKPTCKALWSEKEVPMSKHKSAQLKEEARVREEKASKENDAMAKAFFKANGEQAGVEVFPSGLQIKVLEEGQGAGPPELDQRVTVHYRGVLIDCIPQDGPVLCKGGTEFDSTFSCKEGTPSAERTACEKNKPISFTPTQAGTFWLEILPRMKEGARVEVYVPYKLAYGSSKDPNKRPAQVGPKAALIFQVDLLKVMELPPQVPEVSIPGAKTTYRIVTSGKDDAAIVEVGDTVTVHATGSVAKTGKQFWSTKDVGQQPFSYTAGGGVIVGWDVGARGMRMGEVRQLKIPADEGYGASGFPAWGIPPNGDLGFELEVLQIKKASAEL